MIPTKGDMHFALNWIALLLATMLISATSEAATLGRLFFTPVERSSVPTTTRPASPIVSTRREITAAEKEAAQAKAAQAKLEREARSAPIELDGIVRRSDGHSTAFINGRAIKDRGLGTGLEVSSVPGASGRLVVSRNGGTGVELAVGESVSGTAQRPRSGVGPGRVYMLQQSTAP